MKLKGKYDVLTVARYVINQCNDKNISISNLKLQKLLYYIQAIFLEIDESICFSDEIQAWAFGPVVPVAYHEFKIYGSTSIPKIDEYLELDMNSEFFFKKVKYDDKVIDNEDKKLIDGAINLYGRYSASTLVSMTHNERPWEKNYKDGQNNTIPLDDIKNYFKDHWKYD